MNLVLVDLGERLQLLRRSLELSQKDLAQTLSVGQNQISRLENGLGGSIDLLLLLINFYDEHFQICNLFKEHFEIVKKGEDEKETDTYNYIALERLKFLKDEVNEKLEGIIKVMEHI
ncbi:helix-turn-helix domain-containing protein [Rufibacter sp. XAAS-G3-1]|uniref:helix-turn-helix domain-containing protein n=1 Tax=Rufibacter sp. XAAS-G3-1 TaxID=2729134 RepID=UPI0015E78788|nr:transcriptional regulator [Rufibacter sp. XAAS-G3-1]